MLQCYYTSYTAAGTVQIYLMYIYFKFGRNCIDSEPEFGEQRIKKIERMTKTKI